MVLGVMPPQAGTGPPAAQGGPGGPLPPQQDPPQQPVGRDPAANTDDRKHGAGGQQDAGQRGA
jgi:hypothetical protein